MSRLHDNQASGRRRAAVSGRVLAIVALLSAFGLCAPAVSAVGPHLGASDDRGRAADEPDAGRPGSACHKGPGTPADLVPTPPLALPAPAVTSAPPAAGSGDPCGITGAAHDGAHRVDLHLLQVQRI